MKNIMRNTLIVLASSFALNAAQAADGNGGLMAELMAKNYPAQVITDSAAQARLAQVAVPGDRGNGNGGLMSELMASRFPEKPVSEESQNRLSQVRIFGSENGDGGLMSEMQQRNEEFNAARVQRVEDVNVRG